MEDAIDKDTLGEFHYSAAEIKLLDKVKETKSIYKIISLMKKIEETSLKIDLNE